jgi:hypothetical protein
LFDHAGLLLVVFEFVIYLREFSPDFLQGRVQPKYADDRDKYREAYVPDKQDEVSIHIAISLAEPGASHGGTGYIGLQD